MAAPLLLGPAAPGAGAYMSETFPEGAPAGLPAGPPPHGPASSDAAAGNLMLETIENYQDAARTLWAAIREIRLGRYDRAKEAGMAVRELRAAFQMAMDERARVEKLGRDTAGSVRDQALDLDAARAEIGRRLACLRDAGAD